MYLLNVAVIDQLPADMVLGWDLPVLNNLLQAAEKELRNVDTVIPINLSYPAFTRSQARAGLQPLPDLVNSLVQGGTKGPRKSCRQRRLRKYQGAPTPEAAGGRLEDCSWQVPGNIGELHQNDMSLKLLFGKAMCTICSNLCDEKSELLNNVLYVQATVEEQYIMV